MAVRPSLPRPSHFPYTTLFRSSLPTELAATTAPGTERPGPDVPRQTTDPILHRRVFQEHARQDRKSTRLNSSHVASSYAVFCLQKKRTGDIEGGPHHVPQPGVL